MPPPPWTTPAQRVFLWKRVSAFREAQEAKKTDDYLVKVYEDWFTKYPQPDNSKIPKDKKRVYDWLRNNATPSRYKGLGELAHQARCTVAQLLLNTIPKAKKRRPQPAHAFSTLYFERGLKEKIEAAYQAVVNDPSISEKPDKLAFYGVETRRLYDEASEEVKKEVNEYRDKVVAEDLGEELERYLYEDELDLDDAEKGRLAEGRQSQIAIDSLEGVLHEIIKAIEETTGFLSHFMVGGPEPFRDGRITTFIVGSGNTVDEETTFLSHHPSYQSSIKEPFGGYLRQMFRPEQRATFANISFRDRTPQIKTSNGIVEPIRTRKGGERKRKAKVSKEGTHEDDIRPRKKNQQPLPSPIELDLPVFTPSSEQLLDTSELITIDETEPIVPTPANPSASTLASNSALHLGSSEQHPDHEDTEIEVDKSQPLQLQFVARRTNSSGSLSFKMASSGSWITQYEFDRLKRIEDNKHLLKEVMRVPASQLLMSQTKKMPAPRQRRDRLNVSAPAATRISPRRQAKGPLALTDTESRPPARRADSANTISASSHGRQSSPALQVDTHARPQACRTSAILGPIENLIHLATKSLEDIDFDENHAADPLDLNLDGSPSNLVQDDSNTLNSSTARLDRRSSSPEAVTSTSALNSPLLTRLDRRLSTSDSEALIETLDGGQDIDSNPRPNSLEADASSSNSEPTVTHDDDCLDRRLTPVAVSAISPSAASGDSCDAHLDRHLSSSAATPSSFRNSHLDFPDFESSTLPLWLVDPIAVLLEKFCGEKELSVVRGLVALEQKWGKIDSKMDTKGRPGAVSWWLSRGRPLEKHETPLDLSSYGEGMRKWWTAHQPSCRVEGSATWPLKQVVPVEETWDVTRKGGKNGLFVFVMALFWWKLEAQSQDSEKAETEFYSVVDDVLYAFKTMLTLDDAQAVNACSSREPSAALKAGNPSRLPADQKVARSHAENMRVTRARTAKR